jgi:hypothetical protein
MERGERERARKRGTWRGKRERDVEGGRMGGREPRRGRESASSPLMSARKDETAVWY